MRRELGDLRLDLCRALGLLDREPGPDGLGDREIVGTVRRLTVDAAATYDVDRRRWAEIDRLIFTGTKIEAIRAVRERYGCGLQEAVGMLYQRYDRLRWERSDEFAKDGDSYWDGFQS